MAVEVTELPLIEPNIKPPINLERWRNKRFLDDELDNTEVPILKPLKSVKVTIEKEQNGQKIIEERYFDSSLQKDFAYYSRTRNLEVNTPRTQLLQNLVDKMIVGTDLKPQVVIMNKGKEYDAFVTPDGTIFISQSILNALSSIDEIGAVLAHEVGHLHLKTFERKVRSSGLIEETGVSWVHEGVSDSLAKDFGEKANLNTFAFGTAIEKISGASRGLEHQGGYMRSSQNVAEHSARHYDTSAKQVEPIPIMLLKRIGPTNSEIIKDRINKHHLGHFKEDLTKLHPRDLQEVYEGLLNNLDNEEKYHQEFYPQSLKLLEEFNRLLEWRLINAGYSETQALTWLTTSSFYHTNQNRYLFKNLEDPIRVSQTIMEVSNIGTLPAEHTRRSHYFKKMSDTVFEDGRGYTNSLDSYFQLLEDYLYDESGGPMAGRIPVNRQSILEILGNLSSLDLGLNEQNMVGRVLETYIEESFYKNAIESRGVIDTDQIVGFLDEAKEIGIKFDPNTIQGVIGRADNQLSKLKIAWGVDSIEVKNYQQIVEALKNYFGQKEWQPFADINQEIDTFFQGLSEPKDYFRWTDNFSNFLFNLRKTFEYYNLDDPDREKFIKYLSDKFDKWFGFTKYSVRKALENPGEEIKEVGDPEENARLARLKIRTVFGLSLFKHEGEEFYRFLEDIISNSGVDPRSFSKVGLINLCSPLFLAIKGSVPFNGFSIYNQDSSFASIRATSNYLPIKNFERLNSIPLIKEIISREEGEDLSTWKKLGTSVETLAHRLDNNAYHACSFPGREPYGATKKEHFDIFSDSALALILFSDHRQAFFNLLNVGIKDEDLGVLYENLTTIYPAETNRDNFLRAIQKRFLQSKNISLEEKTEYLLCNLESLGPEGVLMVADQITSLADYQIFRERLGEKLEGYLNGNSSVMKGLAGDLVTSLLSEGFELAIQTTIDDLSNSQDASTKFARGWFLYNLNLKDSEQIGRARYDPQEKRFITGERSRVAFRSINDIFNLFKNFSHTQRFLTLHKALADASGALSAPDHRRTLARLVTKALHQKAGFVHDVIKASCIVGEPRLVSFPAANMLSPILFRAFDINKVDINKLLIYHSQLETPEGEQHQYLPWKDFITSEDARKIINSTTRQLTVFGSKFTHQPESYFYKAAQQSDLTYQQVSDSLEKQLLQEGNSQLEVGSEIDPNIEAVVKGVEASGALGVRSLQLATQLLKFSPDVERRLSHSFDANPGMKKLIFWERLYQQAQKDPQLASFLNTLEIGDYLGGGSLFTTYSAKRQDPSTGPERDMVVKALNTNAEGFIEQYYALAMKVLKEVEKSRSNRNFAKSARLLLEISREWCKEDIHDLNFVRDDDNFQKTIQNFNQAAGREMFYAPNREFSNVHIKVEDLAQGRTLNKVLNDDKAAPERKKELVDSLMKFFAFQFENSLQNESEQQFYLFHSDPHVGNYIVDNTDNPKMAVIDRSMYLKLNQEDIGLLQNLLTQQNSTSFVNKFITRALDEREITSNVKRRAVWFQVWSALGRELGSQVVSGKVDNFTLLRTMFSELEAAGLKVPLNLRLMIRNIGALKELGQKYGLKLEDYFK